MSQAIKKEIMKLLEPRSGQWQEYYYTKIQKKVYIFEALNWIASVIYIAVETILYLTIHNGREMYFPYPVDDIHLVLLGVFFVLNTASHACLFVGTRSLNLKLIAVFIIYEIFFLCTAIFVIVLTATYLTGTWSLLLLRIFIVLPAIAALYYAFRMSKITKHELYNVE